MYIYLIIKRWLLYIDIIIFAIIAGVLAANLYKLLGKKTHIEGKDKTKEKIKLSSQTTEHFDKNLDDYDQDISSIDKDFSEESFLDGARKAFRIIVSAYKENNLNTAESLLSPEVFSAFQEQADMYNHKLESFQITQLKAAILNIEVVKKIAKIKVLFESTQRSMIEKKQETYSLKDVWTFEKILGNNNPNWVLAEVTTEWFF